MHAVKECNLIRNVIKQKSQNDNNHVHFSAVQDIWLEQINTSKENKYNVESITANEVKDYVDLFTNKKLKCAKMSHQSLEYECILESREFRRRDSASLSNR